LPDIKNRTGDIIMEYLKGIVERITYSNPENGFSVIRIKTENKEELVTAVGTLAQISPGTQLIMKGSWKNDSKFGRQFTVDSYKELMPSTLTGIEKYLGSGLIKGIGPVYAKKIIKQFGLDTIDVIEKTPRRLTEVDGIGEKEIEMIINGWDEQKEIKNVMIFLQSHGISTTFAVKIFKRYGKKSVDVLKENPYRLADDIWGIGFKSADKIAENMGFEPFSYSRCRSGFFYILNEAGNSGHCYLTREELVEEGVKLLDIDEEVIEDHLLTAVRDESLIMDKGCVYIPAMLYSEIAVSKKIKEILKNPVNFSKSDLSEIIKKIEKEENINYDEIQKEAIEKASLSKFMVLTGGPGTGKTTTTLGIIKIFKEMGAEVVLAAPTGRAAKRLSETTRMEAKTIHRLLEFKPGEGYKKNPDNPLKGNILIIDESSMIDLLLMHNLLKAVPLEMNVLLLVT
jgi:exodeoxyribonuclease V alpha subunit